MAGAVSYGGRHRLPFILILFKPRTRGSSVTERDDAQVLDLFTGKPPLPVERVAPPLPPTPPTPDENEYPLEDTQIAELRYAVEGIDQSSTPAEMRYYIAEIRRILDG